jgi:hypothetical protein
LNICSAVIVREAVGVLSSLQASQIGMDEERRRMMMVREKPGRVDNLHVAGPD